jgi:hypothetical protein
MVHKGEYEISVFSVWPKGTHRPSLIVIHDPNSARGPCRANPFEENQSTAIVTKIPFLDMAVLQGVENGIEILFVLSTIVVAHGRKRTSASA